MEKLARQFSSLFTKTTVKVTKKLDFSQLMDIKEMYFRLRFMITPLRTCIL